MENSCKNIREQIPELITGSFSAEKAAELQHHISRCPNCSKYLEALQADDKLLGDFAEAMRPSVGQLENSVIDALQHIPSEKPRRAVSTCRTVLRSRVTKLAVAAVLLIGFGYVAGWLSSRRLPGMEQLKSALESDIRRNLLEEINHDRTLALAGYRADLKEQFDELRAELDQQHRRDLNEFAVKTLAASSAVTNQLLTELIMSIAAVQTRDRRSVVAALSQIESNRLQDKTRFRNGLAAVAVQTADELRQTKLDVAKFIVQAQPDRLMPNAPETSNERSKQ
ncbi:MAG: anti-sigma factor family protein [Planctomycetota bacterium]|jgi:hypothetical protein